MIVATATATVIPQNSTVTTEAKVGWAARADRLELLVKRGVINYRTAVEIFAADEGVDLETAHRILSA